MTSLIARPGQRNLITDVPGIKVGQAHDPHARTGVTVILPDARAVAACDVRGGGPGTRETDSLEPHNLVDAIDAVVLSGGSVYGLAAPDGVTAWLGAQGRGYGLVARSAAPPSPVVPAAILFDLIALGAFVIMKLLSDPFIIAVSAGGIAAIFVFEKVYLVRRAPPNRTGPATQSICRLLFSTPAEFLAESHVALLRNATVCMPVRTAGRASRWRCSTGGASSARPRPPPG